MRKVECAWRVYTEGMARIKMLAAFAVGAALGGASTGVFLGRGASAPPAGLPPDGILSRENRRLASEVQALNDREEELKKRILFLERFVGADLPGSGEAPSPAGAAGPVREGRRWDERELARLSPEEFRSLYLAVVSQLKNRGLKHTEHIGIATLIQLPENAPWVLAQICDETASSQMREMCLSEILRRAGREPEYGQRLWDIFDRLTPALKNKIVAGLAAHRDARALEEFMRRAPSEEELVDQYRNMLHQTPNGIANNKETLWTLLTGVAPHNKRYQLAHAYAGVDRDKAVEGFMTGYDRMEEKGRLEMIQMLGSLAWTNTGTRGAVDRALSAIADTDPYPAAREKAARERALIDATVR